MKKGFRITEVVVLGMTLFAGQRLAADYSRSAISQERLAPAVRHQLVMLPYYSVFDNLEYQVDGDAVTLLGQVTRPTLKSDAEAAVKRIEGVSKVINKIEVLPLSPADDQIRRAVYRSIFSERSPLSRYNWGPVPPIHVIVKGGRATLAGTVDNETDKNMATLFAKTVSGVFSVTNNLIVKKG